MQKYIKNITAIFLALFSLINISKGQDLLNDLDLIEEARLENEHYHRRNVRFGITGSKNVIIKYNPVSLALGGLMYFYQKGISPQFFAGCLYHPSCSEYSRNLIKEFGVLKGVPCSADRLMRCNYPAALDIPMWKVNQKTKKVKESVERYWLKMNRGK